MINFHIFNVYFSEYVHACVSVTVRCRKTYRLLCLWGVLGQSAEYWGFTVDLCFFCACSGVLQYMSYIVL